MGVCVKYIGMYLKVPTTSYSTGKLPRYCNLEISEELKVNVAEVSMKNINPSFTELYNEI